MADNPNNGYPQGGFLSRYRSTGQITANDQERMAVLALSQEIINNAYAQADRVRKAAERQAGEILRQARLQADEIVRRAEKHAAEPGDRAQAAETAPDDARLRAYAARCVEACMADLRQRQQETLDYMDEQWRQLLGSLSAGEAGPEPAQTPQGTVLFPDAEPDVSLGQIEEKVSAIARQLAAFSEEEPGDGE